MEAIITAATVLASYLNVATSNTNGYIYNAVYEDNQVAKVEVFNQDGKSLSRKLQYHYSYDAQGRLASKETLRWNALASEWQPSQLFVYEYTDYGYTLSLSNWSHEAGKYMPSNEKMVYHMVADNVLAVDTYRRNDLDEAFERTSGMLVMNADKDYADL